MTRSPLPTALLSKIKGYKAKAADIKAYLDKRPDEWGRFQSEFNQEINGIYRELMLFEKESLLLCHEDKIYKLRQFFTEKLRNEFLYGDLIKWSFEKPYGYAGDHKIIDEIYRNAPGTCGFDRLFDNYFQMSVISVAVRNRKDDFKQIISGYASMHLNTQIKIMDVACGPCRDIFELLTDDKKQHFARAMFDCFDADGRALVYAGQLIKQDPRVNFTQMNIVRMALAKDIKKIIPATYDVIFSTGLFDYLDDRITIRLLRNLLAILKPGGILAISDVRDKFSNPSIYFMEWVADWNLIYRNDDNFRQLFIEAGAEGSQMSYRYEQQGVMQYVIVKKV